MTGHDRREELILRIMNSKSPVSAQSLANEYGVTRQVIVQDIALLRAKGHDIISTNKGYVINAPKSTFRVMKVRHTDQELREELELIVDLGGNVENVMVNHRVYGKIEARLDIDSRRKVEEFLENIQSGKSSPLKNITSDYHYHRILADSESTLDLIEEKLRDRGFLVEARSL